MFTDLNIFRTAHAMATHAGHRQAVVSRNMANSDTPDYRAQDLQPFAQLLAAEGGEAAMRASRTGHIHGTDPHDWSRAEFFSDAPADPNGNNVSIEEEMFKAVEVKRQHDRALSIYKSALTVLRTSLGRG